MVKSTTEAFAAARAMEAPLGAKLAYYADELRTLLPHVARAYDRLVARLQSGDAGSRAPSIGDPMPPFVLPSQSGKLVASDDLFARRPTVVSFNRGHWCPFCRLEVSVLAAEAASIRSRGGQIVSITPETAMQNEQLRETTHASFDFLSDLDNAYALELGLVMQVDDAVRELMLAGGLDLAQFQKNDAWMLPIPATFVVDRGGRILSRHIDPDFRNRAPIESILAALS